jgi:uncharacterized cupin superfamily protein
MGFDFPESNTRPWPGEDFVFVLEGTHEFVYDGVSYIMNEGDAYYFNSSKAHKSRSIGSKPARILVVFTSRQERPTLRRG